MTVRENLDMGAYVRNDRKTAAYREDLERVFQLFPRLQERVNQTRRHACRAASSRCSPSAGP